MFTVKIKRGAVEQIVTAKEVAVIPDGGACSSIPPSYDDRLIYLHGIHGTSEIEEHNHGLFYVMNEAGRTVATYRLGDIGPDGAKSEYAGSLSGGASMQAA